MMYPSYNDLVMCIHNKNSMNLKGILTEMLEVYTV